MMAKELESRLRSLGVLNSPNVVVGTLHSFCLGHVVQPFAKTYQLDVPEPIRIAPSRVWDACLDRARHKVTGQRYDPDIDRSFKTEITKYHLQRADIAFSKWENQTFAKILESHYAFLREQKFVDFDWIIRLALDLISNQSLVRQYLSSRFARLAVDEYQDLGYPLFRIVTEMIEHTSIGLFAIGDPDQSIYDFAGTDPKYLIQLTQREDMLPIIKLQQNYRSTQEIINISKAILTPYVDSSSDKSGGTCHVYECQPLKQGKLVAQVIQKYQKLGVQSDRIAVLHPWRESRDGTEGINVIAAALERELIEYSLDKHPLYDRHMDLIKWLEDLGYWCLKGWSLDNTQNRTFDDLLRGWDQIAQSQSFGEESDADSRLRIVNLILETKGRDILLEGWLRKVADALELGQIFDEYQKIYPDEVEEFWKLVNLTKQGKQLHDMKLSTFSHLTPSVQLTTLHSGKGMEFEAVIIAGVERIWDNENGKRLLYVGATRAERYLCLIYSRRWPEYAPRVPEFINSIMMKCRQYAYFSHHAL